MGHGKDFQPQELIYRIVVQYSSSFKVGSHEIMKKLIWCKEGENG